MINRHENSQTLHEFSAQTLDGPWLAAADEYDPTPTPTVHYTVHYSVHHSVHYTVNFPVK